MITSRRVHFVIGLYVALLYGVIYTPRAGFCIAIMLSIFKEYEDQVRYQKFVWQNTVMTWLGSLLGFIISGTLSCV